MAAALIDPIPRMVIEAPSGLSASGGHLNTGNGTLDRFGDVAHDALLELLTLDHRSRSREGLLLGRTVGHDHDILDLFARLFERNLQEGPAAHGNTSFPVSDKRDDQRGIGGHIGKFEGAVLVGAHARSRTFDEDMRSDDRRTCGILDRSADTLFVLGCGGNRADESQNAPHECCYSIHSEFLILRPACCE